MFNANAVPGHEKIENYLGSALENVLPQSVVYLSHISMLELMLTCI